MSESKSAWWKTAAIWFGGFLLLLAVLHTVLVSATRARLRAEIDYIKSRGEPVTMKDLAGPKVPDEKNGALLYQQAFQLADSPGLEADVNAVESFAVGTIDPNEWAKVLPSLEKVRPVVELVAQAQAKPQCQFPVNWEAGPGALFPHFVGIRRLARVLAVDAAAKAHQGRSEEAVRSLKLAYGLDGAMDDEPTLIAQLVRIAVLAIAHNSLQNNCDRLKLAEKQSKDLFDQLGRIDLARGHQRAMMGERAMGLWCFENAGAVGISNLVGSGGGGFEPIALMGTYPMRPLLNVDQATYLQLMRRQVEEAGMSVFEAKRKGIKYVSDDDVPKYAVLSRILFPVFARARIATDCAIGALAVVRTALAIETYRGKYGQYPLSLKDLKSGLGWKLPLDPYSGKDLLYRRNQSGFVVYSLGVNMKDDGGVGSLSASRNPNDASDIVWEKGL